MGHSCIISVNNGSFVFERGDNALVQATCGLNRGKRSSSATWTVVDKGLTLANSFPLPRKKDQRVTVDIWFGDGLTPEPVFSGYLTSIRANSQQLRTQFKAVDKSKPGRRKRKVRSLAGRNVADLCREVANESDLKILFEEVELDRELSRFIQHGQTDFEMLQEILEPLGHTSFVEGDTLYVRKVSAVPTTEAYEFRFGGPESILFDIPDAVPSTTENVLTFDGDQAAEGDDDATFRPVNLERVGLVATATEFPSFTDENVQRALQAQKRGAKIFTATLDSTDPLPLAKLDSYVTLKGYGPRFSGVWLIDSVQHSLTRGTSSLSLYNSGVD